MHIRSPFFTALCLLIGCGAPVETPETAATTQEGAPAVVAAADPGAAAPPAARRTAALSEDDPILDLSERGLFFGQVCGGDEAERVLTIRNFGGGWLTISALRLTGDGFSLPGRPGLPLDIAPGGQRALRVRFAPGASRLPAFDGNLRIVSNDPADPATDVVLSGLSLPGSLRVAPRQFNFGTLAEGGTRSVNLTLRVEGDCPVDLAGSRLTGRLAYALRVGALPDMVWPGAPQAINVRLFCGGEDDNVEATLRLVDGANRSVGSAQLLGYCAAP